MHTEDKNNITTSTLRARPGHGGLATVPTARKPEITRISYLLSISLRDTQEVRIVVSKVSTPSVICDVIVCRIYCPPVRVAFGIIVGELIFVGAIAYGAIGGAGHVSTSGLVGTNVGVQDEWAGSEKALIRVVKRCLPCGGRGIVTRRRLVLFGGLTRAEIAVERREIHIQWVGEAVDAPRKPVVSRYAGTR